MMRGAIAVALAACGGQGGASQDAGRDGPRPDAPSIASLCGITPDSTWQRCAADPLVSGFRPTTDGRVKLTEADPTVLYDATAGLWKAWWSTVITPDCTKIGTPQDIHEIDIEYADSPDGLHWTVQDEPALLHGDSTAWDFTTVETPTVVEDPDADAEHRFALVYAGGNNNDLMVASQTGWQLGLAFSPDGKQFTRLPAGQSPYATATAPFTDVTGLVLMSRDAFPSLSNLGNGILADPELHKRNGVWDLYFSSFAIASDQTTPLGYGISHATSTDLIHWTPSAGNPLITGAIGPGTPTVLDDGASLELWYHEDSMADKATSPNALFPTIGAWKRTTTDGNAFSAAGATRDFAWDPQRSYETYGLMPGLAMVRDPSGPIRMYYSAWGDEPAPAGSCVYTQTGIVAGTHSLSLALRAP